MSATEYQFISTTNPQSERQLANTLGYPSSWHVVRKSLNGGTRFSDTIFAGDPNANADTYYNHPAAYDAALKWKEGESTPYDDAGGQMMSRFVSVELGDEVECLYDGDGGWYRAYITKITEYHDDVRYTVEYVEDSATQANICQDQIRTLKNKKKRKLPSSSSAKKKSKKKSTETTRKGPGRPPKNEKKNGNSISNFFPRQADLKLAKKVGLPSGWSAKVRSGSRYTFRSPDGTTKIHGIKKVFEHLGLPVPAHGLKVSDAESDDNEGDTKVNIEEGDPPWRTSGNKYLGKSVRLSIEDVEEVGTVTGWISDKDVDKDGAPGYTSEKTGKPADLFHVSFVSKGPVWSQDLEEFEILENLVQP